MVLRNTQMKSGTSVVGLLMWYDYILSCVWNLTLKCEWRARTIHLSVRNRSTYHVTQNDSTNAPFINWYTQVCNCQHDSSSQHSCHKRNNSQNFNGFHFAVLKWNFTVHWCRQWIGHDSSHYRNEYKKSIKIERKCEIKEK